MIEMNLDTLAMDAEATPDQALKTGAPPLIHCQVVGANELPLVDPGTGRALRYPSLVVNWGLTKKAALQYAAKLKEEAEKLPDGPSSSIITASNMAEVEQVAKFDKKIRK